MAAPNNERDMEEEEEVVIIYELVTVESSGEEAEGNMTEEEEEEDNMTEEEEDSMEEEEDGDEPEDYEDSMMEEEEDDLTGEEEDVFYSSGEEGSLMEEEEGDVVEESGNEEGEVAMDQEGVEYYVSDEEEDLDMLEEADVGAEVRPPGMGLDVPYPGEDAWGEGLLPEEQVGLLRQQLADAGAIIAQWEDFHRQSLESGAYIGTARASTVAALGGWPLLEAIVGPGLAQLVVYAVALTFLVASLTVVLISVLVAWLIVHGRF